MENREQSLTMQQAWVSAPKIQEKDNSKEQKERKEAAKRFGGLSLGCFLYALVYAFCMYENKAGITFPFFVVATLYFFYYFTKKYWGIMKRNNRFFEISVILLGVITCTTTSGIIIFINKMLILFLLCVMSLRTYHDVVGWSVGDYLCSACYIVCGGIGNGLLPLTDAKCFWWEKRESIREKKPSDETKRKGIAILVGIVIGIPMLFFTGIMLSSADAYFASLFEEVFEFLFDYDWDFYERMSNMIQIGITVVIMFLFSYGTIVYLSRRKSIEALVHKEKMKWDSYVAITFSTLISIMYGLFVWIQIAGLFMGALSLPEGYTYAEYARQGFFQLVFVCLFNVCLVLICMSCFKKHKVLQGLLTVISLCTYVMLISSVYRMFLYIREYHLTFLRVFVLWAILVIAVVMVGVIVAIYKERYPLFMHLLICVTSLYIGFAAMHPDYVIAKYNIAQKEAGRDIDDGYLRWELSMDAAVPILHMYEKEGYIVTNLKEEYHADDGYEEKKIRDYYWKIKKETQDMKIRDYNFSKSIALYGAEKFARSMK